MTLPQVDWAMPFESPSLLDEPVEFEILRARHGLTKILTSTGDSGWIVTRYRDVKSLSVDLRIGRSHSDPDRAPRLWDAAFFVPVPDPGTEIQNHQRWRRAISQSLSTSRVQSVLPRMKLILERLVTEMMADGPPADICARVARPFASQVLFDLLGVPVSDRAKFVDWSDRLRDQRDRQASAKSYAEMTDHVGRLLQLMRGKTADDVISGLVNFRDSAGSLTPGQMTLAAVNLVIGGFETVANRIAHGLVFLLLHSMPWEPFVHFPTKVSAAVDEVMRMAVPGGSWLPRYALTDIEYDGSVIRAGELVVFSIQSANRDPTVFSDAVRFDMNRSPNPHIGFGHGKFYCPGAGLARAELTVALTTLFRRLPGLRLSVPTEDLRVAGDKAGGGLRSLPVTWQM